MTRPPTDKPQLIQPELRIPKDRLLLVRAGFIAWIRANPAKEDEPSSEQQAERAA